MGLDKTDMVGIAEVVHEAKLANGLVHVKVVQLSVPFEGHDRLELSYSNLNGINETLAFIPGRSGGSVYKSITHGKDFAKCVGSIGYFLIDGNAAEAG